MNRPSSDPVSRARLGVLALLAILLAAALPARSRAGLEVVTVRGAAGDSVVVERRDGARWRVTRGPDSLSAWAWIGRPLLVFSPGPFLGTGSRLLIPDWDQQCSVLGAAWVGRAKTPAGDADPDVATGLRAMRDALELMGFDCGGASRPGWNDACRSAFLAYRQRRGLDLSTPMLGRSILALGLDVMAMSHGSGTSVRIANALSERRDQLAAALAGSDPGSGGLNCDIATAIRAISEARDRVTLLDGSLWALSGEASERVRGWSAADSVVACGPHLISLRTGEMVRATPAKP